MGRKNRLYLPSTTPFAYSLVSYKIKCKRYVRRYPMNRYLHTSSFCNVPDLKYQTNKTYHIAYYQNCHFIWQIEHPTKHFPYVYHRTIHLQLSYLPVKLIRNSFSGIKHDSIICPKA